MASDVIRHIEDECKNGNFDVVRRCLEKYEERIAQLETQLCENSTASYEAATLRHLHIQEQQRIAALRRQHEVLLFRTRHNLVGPLTEDLVMDDSNLTIDQQSHVIFESFNIPEVAPLPDMSRTQMKNSEHISAVDSHVYHLRASMKSLKCNLLAQVVERLTLKRALDTSSSEEQKMGEVLEGLRKDVARVRSEEGLRNQAMITELAETKRKLAQVHSQMASEIERAAADSRNREESLEAQNAALKNEVNVLRAVENSLRLAEKDLDEAKVTLVEVQKIGSTHASQLKAKVMADKGKHLKLVRRLSCALQGTVDEEAPTPRVAVADDGEELPETEGSALDVMLIAEARKLEDGIAEMMSLAQRAAKSEVVMEQLRKDQEVVVELEAMHVRMLKLMTRMDTKLLEQDVAVAVQDCIALEAQAHDAKDFVRGMFSLSPNEKVYPELPRAVVSPPEPSAPSSISETPSRSLMSSRGQDVVSPPTPPPPPAVVKEPPPTPPPPTPPPPPAVVKEPPPTPPPPTPPPPTPPVKPPTPAIVKLTPPPTPPRKLTPISKPAPVEALKEALFQEKLPEYASFVRDVDAHRLRNLSTCNKLVEAAQNVLAMKRKLSLPPLDEEPKVEAEPAPSRAGGTVTGKLVKPPKAALHAPGEVSAPKLVLKAARTSLKGT